jgi:predicted DNA-binding protein
MRFAKQLLIKERGNMGRKKVDRSNKIMQTFETTKPLKVRLKNKAAEKKITVSALIREILEKYFEERD